MCQECVSDRLSEALQDIKTLRMALELVVEDLECAYIFKTPPGAAKYSHKVAMDVLEKTKKYEDKKHD